MKLNLETITKTIIISICSLLILLLLSMFCNPLGDLVFGVCFGKVYVKKGETSVYIANEQNTASIYKAKNKPFLLVGPLYFSKGFFDFFFVSKTQVLRGSPDKGGDTWCRIVNLLFMVDDLSDDTCLRSPIWSDIDEEDNASIIFDKKNQKYIYSFHLQTPRRMVSFSIPAKLFTKDMPKYIW